MKVDGFGGEIRQSDWLTHSFPWLRPFATDLWGGLTDFQIQGLCTSLLIEPFKKILHCHWLIFSTDSQREVFVNTALVFTSELLFRTFTITSDFYQRYLETFSTMFSLRLRQTIWNLYTTFTISIRSLKRISMPHERILLTSY